MADFHVGRPTIWPLIGPARDVSPNGSSAECIKWAVECLDNCNENHGRCRKDLDSVLPYRLIDVGDDSKDPHLLINDKKARGKYIALSHCWGGQSPLCLTSNTLVKFERGIPSKDIPSTFRDAIQICRLLSVKYIWIDSLCIIQDSTKDWREQAAQMCDYYSNSWVVIAADGAPNSSHGFLTDKRRKINVQRFKCPGLNGESEICVRRKGAGGLHDSFSHHYWVAPSSSPLSSRGWILQESLLAPRILHFTAEEITWECLEESRCECQVGPHHFEVERPLKLRIDALPFHTRWINLVNDYTNRSLTRQGDKLLAISGLARKMQEDKEASYWAGLWSDTFPSSLLWWVLDRYQTPGALTCFSKRIIPFQAPTWSWASVTGRILLTSETIVSDLENFSVSVTAMGSDPYGSLKSASITFNAFLALVSVQKAEEGYKLSAFSTAVTGGNQMLSHIEPDVQDNGYYDIEIGKKYWMLLIGHTASNAHCILIREVQGRSDTYERVGFVHFFGLGKFKDIATKKECDIGIDMVLTVKYDLARVMARRYHNSCKLVRSIHVRQCDYAHCSLSTRQCHYISWPYLLHVNHGQIGLGW